MAVQFSVKKAYTRNDIPIYYLLINDLYSLGQENERTISINLYYVQP